MDLDLRPDPALEASRRTEAAGGDAPRRAVPPPGTRGRGVASLLFLAAVVCWALALPSMGTEAVDHRGLLFAASPLFALSLVLAAGSFGVAIAHRQHGTAAAALVTSVLLTRLPTAVVLPLPLYSWTYKHFGVVDYITTFGGVDTAVDIYHSWPGMFAFFAWVNDLTGSTSLDLAHGFIPLYHLALTGASYVLARSWRLTPRRALVAAFVAHAANWVAQDYFSPQSVAFLLAVAVLALFAHVGTPLRGGVAPRHPAAVWVALVMVAAITVSHQLTPYWLVAVLAVLVVLRMAPWWSVPLFGAVVLAQLAVNYEAVRVYGSLITLNPLANATHDLGGVAPSFGQQLTAWAGRFTSMAVWACAGLVLVRRFRRHRGLDRARRQDLALGAVALGSFALLLGQGYGGEAIFRVFLYSVPGCAVVLAPAVEAALVTGRRRPGRAVVAWIGTLVLTLSAAQASYGAWFANRVDADALNASVWIVQSAPVNARMVALAPGAPGRVVARYADFARTDPAFDAGVGAWGWLGDSFSDSGKVTRMTDSALYNRQPMWVVLTRQMTVYSEYYGLFPEGALDRFQQQLLDNPHWIVHTNTATLTVLELDLDP